MNVDEPSKFPASGATNVEAAAVGGVLKRMDDVPITDKARTGCSTTMHVGNNVSPNISPSVVEALASIAAANDGGDVVEKDSKKGAKEATGGLGGTEDESLAPNGLISSSVVQVPCIPVSSTCENRDDADRKHHDSKKDAQEPNSPCSKSEMVDDKAVNPTSVSAEASVGATGSSSVAGNNHDVDHDVEEKVPTEPRVFAASNNDKLSHGTDSKGSSLDSATAGGVGDSVCRNDEQQSHSRPMEQQSNPIQQPKKRRRRPQRAGARPRGRREVRRENRQPPASLVLRDGDPSAPQVHEADAYLDEDQIGARLFAELNDYKTQASREREHDDFYYRYYWEAPSSESESDYEETETEERAHGEESGDGKESGTTPSATDDGGMGAAVSNENPSIAEGEGAAERSDQPRRRSTRKASTVATSRIAGGGGGQHQGSSSSSAEKGGGKNGRKGKSANKKNNRRFTRRMARDLDQEIANLGLNALVAAMLEIEEEEGGGGDEDDTPRPAGGTKPGRLKRGRGGHGNAKGTSRSSSAMASVSTSSKKNSATGKNAGARVYRRGNKTSKAKNNPDAPRQVQRTTMLGRKRKHRVLENEAKVDMDEKDEKKRRRQVSISPPWPPPSPEPRKRRKIANPPKDDSETAGLFCGSSIAMAKEAKDRILAATFRSATAPDTQESEQEERGAGTTTSSDDGYGGGTAVGRDGGPISPPSPMESPSAATAMATSARSSPTKSANKRRFLVALLKREADSNGTGKASLDPLTPHDGNSPAGFHAAVAVSNADSSHLAMADNHLSNDKTTTPSTESAKSPTTARVTRIIVNGKPLLLPLEHDGRRCRRGKNTKTTPDAAVNSKSMVIPKTAQAQRTSPESVADGVGAKSPLFSEAALESPAPVISPSHLPSTPAWIAEPRGKRTPYSTHHPMWHRKLIHCMRSGGRRWARHEFFYSDIDRAWFKRNEYVIDLAKLGIPPNAKLTQTEWRAVRQLLPHRPKRFSPRFVSSQLKKLHCYRDQVRGVQRAAIAGSKEHLPHERLLQGGSSKIAQRVPMPIRVGTTVTAYSRQAQMVQRGIVMGRDYQRNTYIVQFDCKELGYEVCPDFEVARQFQVSTSEREKGAVAVGRIYSHPISGRPYVKKDSVAGNEKSFGATSIVDASATVPPLISSGTHSVNSSPQLCIPVGSTEPQMRPPIKIG